MEDCVRRLTVQGLTGIRRAHRRRVHRMPATATTRPSPRARPGNSGSGPLRGGVPLTGVTVAPLATIAQTAAGCVEEAPPVRPVLVPPAVPSPSIAAGGAGAASDSAVVESNREAIAPSSDVPGARPSAQAPTTVEDALAGPFWPAPMAVTVLAPQPSMIGDAVNAPQSSTATLTRA